MVWKILVLSMIVLNVPRIIIMKILTDKFEEKELIVLYQYSGALLMVVCYGLLMRQIEFGKSFLFAGGIGFANAFVNYLQWRTYVISLSKTSLLLSLSGPLSVFLAGWLLKESEEWTNIIRIGMVSCITAAGLFAWAGAKKASEEKVTTGRFFLFIAIMIIITSISSSLIKLMANPQAGGKLVCSSSTFLVGWYSGGFLTSLLIFFCKKHRTLEVQWLLPSFFLLGLLMVVSFLMAANLLLFYFMFNQEALVSVVVPIRDLAVFFAPIFVGLFRFKEKQGLSEQERWGFSLGISGVLLLILYKG